MRNLFLLVLILCACLNFSQAQGQKVEFEKVKEKCEGIDFDDRVRIVVADFIVASPKVRYREFGSELATMLTNALHEINCFKVLEKMSVMQSSEVAKEGNLAKEGNIQSYVATDNPQMLAAQAIVTGDITEFASSGGKTTVMGVGVGSPKVRFGFILKVINPRTREVIWSKSIEVVSKKAGAFSGVSIGGWLKVAGSDKFNKAEADAVERGIIQAMYALSDDREEINFPEIDNSSVTVLEVSGAGFMELKKLMDSLKGESQFKSVVRTSFKQDHGTLQIRHELTEDEILNIVAEKGNGLAEIVGFEGNVIQVQIVDK